MTIKAWHYLELIYCSLLLEFVVPYVEECIKIESNPTTNLYWGWFEDLENPNCIYLHHSVFTHLHAHMTSFTGLERRHLLEGFSFGIYDFSVFNVFG